MQIHSAFQNKCFLFVACNCFVVNKKKAKQNAIVETKVRCYLFNFMRLFRQYLIKTTVSLSPHPICDIIIKQLAHF